MLIVPRGIPASGKSTWCKDFVKHTGRSVRLSRDDYRAMMYGVDFGPPVDEDLVTKIFKTSAYKLLGEVNNLILDNTNINLDPIRPILFRAKEVGVRVKFVYFDIDLDEALARNAARERKVPDHVIRGFHARYLKIDREADSALYE